MLKIKEMLMNRRNFLQMAAAAGLGLVGVDALVFEPSFIEYTEHTLGEDVSGHFRTKATIIQISDLHLRDLAWHHHDLAEKINAIKPEFLFFTGDIIDKGRNIPLLHEFLNLFNNDMIKIAILGNWERQAVRDMASFRNIYEDHCCDLLVNQSKVYDVRGSRVVVTGLDDLYGGLPDFSGALRNVSRERNHIVLAHCPQHRDFIINDIAAINSTAAEDKKITVDYIFSGHTHGGQVSLFGSIPFLPRGSGRYVRGWYKDKRPHLYVSRGIGTSMFPIRLGARAEVPVFTCYLR